MADNGIFCTQAEMLMKAGASVSSVVTAAVDTTFVYSNSFISQAESTINCDARYNFSDHYATLNVDVKEILKQTASDLAAMYCIQYDMSGFSSRYEAETMLDLLRDSALRGLGLLRDQKVVTFINGAT